MKLFVYHTPELTPPGNLPECAIAVDVLRATSTIATALEAGAEAIQVFADLDSLVAASASHPSHLCLRAAERGGAKVEGFDLGNSPLDCTRDRVAGKRIFMSTTNGTRTLERLQAAPMVIAAALINLGSVLDYLTRAQPENIWIVGSGWEGSFSLEDTVCAGAIADRLADRCELANDEAIAARALFQQWHPALGDLLRAASHGKRLLRLGCDADLDYCARLDAIDVLPVQTAPGTLTAKSWS